VIYVAKYLASNDVWGVFADGWTGKDVKGIGLSSLEAVVRPERLPGATSFVKSMCDFWAEKGGGNYVNCQSRVQCCQLIRLLAKRETLHIHLFHLSWRIILNKNVFCTSL
jgi:hypothetical protein